LQACERLKKLVVKEMEGLMDDFPITNQDPSYLDDFEGPRKVEGGLGEHDKYLYRWTINMEQFTRYKWPVLGCNMIKADGTFPKMGKRSW